MRRAQMDVSSALRRIALVPIPGLADHFLTDYQQAIEATLLQPQSKVKTPACIAGKRTASLHPEILVTTQGIPSTVIPQLLEAAVFFKL